jgi:hypothetical protein
VIDVSDSAIPESGDFPSLSHCRRNTQELDTRILRFTINLGFFGPVVQMLCVKPADVRFVVCCRF